MCFHSSAHLLYQKEKKPPKRFTIYHSPDLQLGDMSMWLLPPGWFGQLLGACLGTVGSCTVEDKTPFVLSEANSSCMAQAFSKKYVKQRSISWCYISDVPRGRNAHELGRSHTRSQCYTPKCKFKTRVRSTPRPFFFYPHPLLSWVPNLRRNE